MPSPQNDAPYMRPNTASNNLSSSRAAAFRAAISRLGTPMMVRVLSVHNEGVAITGTVDVQPLVNQQDKLGREYQRAPVYGVPYLRIQGGTSAIIVDPQAGDIGFIIISGRDHTHVVTNRDAAPPASFRQFSMQDCVYVGGFINGAPSQYIQATADGWRIVTPGSVSIEAAQITADCDIVTSGDVKAGGISLKNHTHGGIQPGGGTTGKPQ